MLQCIQTITTTNTVSLYSSLPQLSTFLSLKKMALPHRRQRMPENTSPEKNKNKNKPKFSINDHLDILIEILTKLDDRSLAFAACVCRLWCTISRNDTLWENLCFRHLSPPPTGVRPVVLALGGYKRLYMVCVRPVLSRLGGNSERVRRIWTRDELQLALSLFCVDYYEKLDGRIGGDAAPASSLMFLCNPVNV